MAKGWLRRLVPFPRRATLRRWFPSFETRNIAHLIARSGADLLVDAGANEGQFARRMRAAGLGLPILSVEPLAGPHGVLSAHAARDPAWQVAPRLALGGSAGRAVLHRYADHTLSSVLAPHPRAAGSPALGIEGTEEVERITLDALLAAHAPAARRPFLKLDVQGAELDILAGAPAALSAAPGLLVELPLMPSYAGEPGYLEILGALDSAGFVPVYCARVVARRRLGPWLQMDCLLLRRDGI
ncbi:FkbM family methyltransferase [Paralimibaculum aggregatum]|uniref:FkbM family methyltransferase n=1 Tax=Paralimibaculum aggregatum TaxID=3036245 RepID=A0ABQ6LIZ4_9RHOB|nr:FkbM family methyltransferase [Limibaculum sp. NKW23]GMG83253.1 FkbM family methyltransferase [Limibaculum sp. NKW23]